MDFAEDRGQEQTQSQEQAQYTIKFNIKDLRKAETVQTDKEILQSNDASSLSEHNDQYTELLKAYVENFKDNSKQNRDNKQKLFEVAMLLLKWMPVAAVLLIIAIIGLLAFGRVEALEMLTGMVTALASLFGTYMIVPKLITKYLYNKDEEKHLADIIGKIQEYDKNIRDGL